MIDLAQRYKGIVFYNPAECRCIMDMHTVEQITKDLELKDLLEIELNEEKLKIEYLMKKLKKQDGILEILRNNIAYVDIVKEQKETLEITIRVKEEDRPKIKGWLENGKDNK